MEILEYIGDVFYAAFMIVLFVTAVIVLYDYLKERSRIKAEQEDVSDEDYSECSEWINDVGTIVMYINDASERIRKMNNPDLNCALESLNSASSKVLAAVQVVVDLNYPIEED